MPLRLSPFFEGTHKGPARYPSPPNDRLCCDRHGRAHADRAALFAYPRDARCLVYIQREILNRRCFNAAAPSFRGVFPDSKLIGRGCASICVRLTEYYFGMYNAQQAKREVLVADDRVAALRRYVFEYCAGALWTTDVLLMVPDSISRIGLGLQSIDAAFGRIRAPEVLLVIVGTIVTVLLPYGVGLLCAPLTAIALAPLSIARHNRWGRRFPNLVTAGRRITTTFIFKGVDGRDQADVLGLILLDLGKSATVPLGAALDELRFRMTNDGATNFVCGCHHGPVRP